MQLKSLAEGLSAHLTHLELSHTTPPSPPPPLPVSWTHHRPAAHSQLPVAYEYMGVRDPPNLDFVQPPLCVCWHPDGDKEGLVPLSFDSLSDIHTPQQRGKMQTHIWTVDSTIPKPKNNIHKTCHY